MILASSSELSLNSWSMHALFLWNTMSTSMAIYIMLRHTPQSMTNYRPFLINVAMTSYAFDTWETIVYVPISLLPSLIGGCTMGLLQPLGAVGVLVGWIGFSITLGACGISLAMMIYYRLFAVFGRAHWMMKWWVLVGGGILQFTYTMPTVIQVLYMRQGEAIYQAYIKENVPDLLDYYSSNSCTLITTDGDAFVTYFIMAIVFILAMTVLNITAMGTTMCGMNRMRAQMSQRTYRQHKQLIYSSVVQFIIPTTFLAVPYIVLATSALLRWESAQTIALVCFNMGAVHSSLNSVLVVITIQPYRKAALSYVKRALIYFHLQRHKEVTPVQSGYDLSQRKPTIVSIKNTADAK